MTGAHGEKQHRKNGLIFYQTLSKQAQRWQIPELSPEAG
jgi:hypothetical protein